MSYTEIDGLKLWKEFHLPHISMILLKALKIGSACAASRDLFTLLYFDWLELYL